MASKSQLETTVTIQCAQGVRQIPAFIYGTGGMLGRVFVFPEAQPGIEQQDRVTAVNGVRVLNEQTLVTELVKFTRGLPMNITVARRPASAASPSVSGEAQDQPEAINVQKQNGDIEWGIGITSDKQGVAVVVQSVSEAAGRTQLQIGLICTMIYVHIIITFICMMYI